jgi:hypothetical protein
MAQNSRADRTQPALDLWEHLYRKERGLLAICHKVGEDLRTQYFNYPDAARTAAKHALEKSDKGHETWFCAHLLTSPRRVKENAASIGALWFDKDRGEPPNGQLKASALVESSPGHYHGYLRLTDSIPPETAEELNRRLAQEIGADPSGYDLSQLLRVPMTVNYKYADHPVVRLLGIKESRCYSPAVLDELLPEIEEPEGEDPEGEDPDPENSDSGEMGEEPPVELDAEAMKVWRGEKPKPKDDGSSAGEIDRSATLLKIGRVLYDAGANKSAIVPALAERDRTLGYNKYSGNRDGGRKEYERICTELKASGRTPRFTLISGKGQGPASEADPTEAASQLLEMEQSAYRGLFGQVVETVDPHTEGDPVAVLASILTMFGNAAGRGPFVEIGATKHRLNLFVGIVGETAKGRKGSATDPVENIMHAADRRWAESRIASGLSSGEGLLNEIRDPVEARDKDGSMKTIDPGVSDKRLLVSEGELSQGLQSIKRDGNSLSPILRNLWDGKNVRTLVKHSPLKSTNPHVSILGHITRSELMRDISETEMANGLANRFLWLRVKRSKSLPFGGEWHKVDLAPLSRQIVSALEFANRPLRMTWANDARDLWMQAYEMLSEEREGLFGAVTARAEAQALRLAMLYAIADLSEEMRFSHVESALAVWEYADKSARAIFGEALGDRDADKALSAIKASGSLTRTEVSALFGRNKSRQELDRIRDALLRAKRIRLTFEKVAGTDKPVERWHAA